MFISADVEAFPIGVIRVIYSPAAAPTTVGYDEVKEQVPGGSSRPARAGKGLATGVGASRAMLASRRERSLAVSLAHNIGDARPLAAGDITVDPGAVHTSLRHFKILRGFSCDVGTGRGQDSGDRPGSPSCPDNAIGLPLDPAP